MLSDRQQGIVALIADLGPDFDRIADELDISPSTVRDQINRLCVRFQCQPADLPRLAAEIDSP